MDPPAAAASLTVETAAATIERCCDELRVMHPPGTFTGMRTHDLVRDIQDAARDLARCDELSTALLIEAQTELQAKGNTT